MQDFPDEYLELLQNSDLTNDHDRTTCIQAATLLTQALSVQLQPGLMVLFRKKCSWFDLIGMEKMTAIRERRELLERTQKAFSLRCKNFLSSKFLFHVRIHSSNEFDHSSHCVVFFRPKDTVNVLNLVGMNCHVMERKLPDHFYHSVLCVNG
jgi:Exocyst complex component Sec3